MKYRKNGRMYKTVRGMSCIDCCFFPKNTGCLDVNGKCCEVGGLRETLFSKIRNWRKKP